MMLRSVELALLLMLGMVGVSIWLVVRSVRRRVRRLRAGFGALPALGFSLLQGYGDRHRMWRAVTAAERAVAAAVSADAASGDLTSLVRRLRRAAQSVDRLLATAGPRASAEVTAELRRILEMSETIRVAATEALLTVTSPATTSLAE